MTHEPQDRSAQEPDRGIRRERFGREPALGKRPGLRRVAPPLRGLRGAWRRTAAVSSALWLLASVPALAADDVPALLTDKRCNACHEASATLIGPPYAAIAARHRGAAAAMVEVLARKIVLGGGGNWGLVPMVPNEHVTLDEARAMATWILAVER